MWNRKTSLLCCPTYKLVLACNVRECFQSHWLSPAVTADSIPLCLQRNITTQVSPFICCHPSMMPPQSFRQRRGSLAPRQRHLLKMIECSVLERNSCCDQSLQSTLEKTWGGSIWNHWVPLQWQQCWSKDLESWSFFSWTHNKKTPLSQAAGPGTSSAEHIQQIFIWHNYLNIIIITSGGTRLKKI